MSYDNAFLSRMRSVLEERQAAIVQQNREKLGVLVRDYAERQGDSIDITTAEQTDATDLLFQDRLKAMLQEIEGALRKLDDGTYGECEECGDPIVAKRLEIQPTARYCVECKEEIEQEAKRRYKRPGLLDEFIPE
jgi:DnaK suppressor protein